MDLFAPWHLIILLAIVLVIFGPAKLGDVGAALGRAVRDFKKTVDEPPTDIREQKSSETHSKSASADHTKGTSI